MTSPVIVRAAGAGVGTCDVAIAAGIGEGVDVAAVDVRPGVGFDAAGEAAGPAAAPLFGVGAGFAKPRGVRVAGAPAAVDATATSSATPASRGGVTVTRWTGVFGGLVGGKVLWVL